MQYCKVNNISIALSRIPCEPPEFLPVIIDVTINN